MFHCRQYKLEYIQKVVGRGRGDLAFKDPMAVTDLWGRSLYVKTTQNGKL
jgi:hypothetical protein